MRSKTITIVIILLLSSATIIGSFGLVAYMVTCQQVDAINSAYSTLAAPSRSYWVDYNKETSTWQLSYYHNGVEVQCPYSVEEFENVVNDTKIVAYQSKGRAVGAIAHDLIIPSKYEGNGNITTENAEVNYSVFHITCTTQPVYENDMLTFSATVEDILSIHPDYPAPNKLTVWLEDVGLDEQGHPLVQVGEQYVVWGRYTTATYVYGVGESKHYDEDITQRSLWCQVLRPYSEMTSQYYETGVLRWRLPDVDYPEILAPSDDRVIDLIHSTKELREVIPIYGLGAAGINGMMCFHTGLYYLTNGRDFLFEELSEGARVCVINKQMAERNGLQVGSTISLSLFDTGTLYSINSRTDAVNFRMDVMPGTCNRRTADFTVIGIYSGPAAQEHINNVPLNTIFVPEAALPKGTLPAQKIKTNMGFTLSIPSIPIGKQLSVLQTYVLHKSQTPSFVQAMDNLGMGDFFAVHDNGYSRISKFIDGMQSDTQIVLIICITVEILILLCVLFFYTMQRRREHYRLMQLGATRRWICGYYAVGLCLISLCALLLGNAVSVLMSNTFIDLLNQYSLLSLNVFAKSVQQNVSNVKLTMSNQIAILVIHTFVFILLDVIMTGIGCLFRGNSMRRRRNLI